jgi:hypothetical protein
MQCFYRLVFQESCFYLSSHITSASLKLLRFVAQEICSLSSPFNQLYGLLSQENPNCLLIVTPKGGRLGWVAGAEAPVGPTWKPFGKFPKNSIFFLAKISYVLYVLDRFDVLMSKIIYKK